MPVPVSDLVCLFLCSPSVLDRLNALLEPGGVLSISERGVIDGEVPTIKPHPNFRLELVSCSFCAVSEKFVNGVC